MTTEMDRGVERGSRLAPWLRVPAPMGRGYDWVDELMRSQRLHTVCEEAHCPNSGECWNNRTATFLILGDTCTRNCRFCNVKTGCPTPPDSGEPERVARSVRAMGLEHAVITSVDRDDLPDGGASAFAAVIRKIRDLQPGCTVEVLIPDFQGAMTALETVLDARPDVLGHNIETVPRLYRSIQPQCRYDRSLDVLRQTGQFAPEVLTKSGLMVGLGETMDEVVDAMGDLCEMGVDILTLGQYLQPSAHHAAVERYYPPDEFDMLRRQGVQMGFEWVESGPLVRSSYNAAAQVRALAAGWKQL